MYIVSVIPISKSIPKEILTYFSNSKVPIGQIVSIPFRSKNIDGIVTQIEEAQKIKTEIKKADFKLKKINSIKGFAPFSPTFLETCKRISKYSLVNIGSVVNSFLPKIFLENIELIDKNRKILIKKENKTLLKQEKLILQAPLEDRLDYYKTLIRECFSKNKSIFICAPTQHDVEKLKEIFQKGIEQYVFSFHGSMTKKEILLNYKKIIDEKHPILIIGTGMFLFISRDDLEIFVLENESSGSYKQFYKPFLDTRTFIEIMTSINKAKLIFGDTLLRPETYHRYEAGEFGEIKSPVFRFLETKNQIIVDMKKENLQTKSKKFVIISEKAKQTIEKSLKNRESIILFTIRKGLAGTTVCGDCHQTLLCPNCSTPIVLYSKKDKNSSENKEKRIFMCNKCGKKEKTEIKCPNCNSWNLNPLGIGIDRVYEEIKTLFPKKNIVQLDKETVVREKEALQLIENFENKKGSILIGTEMIFSYLKNKVENSIIISLDSLLSIPNFNINQKIINTIEKLDYFTKNNLIIQTRVPENLILQSIENKNIISLYREDLEERKKFNYPPFKKLIKITFSGTIQENEKVRVFLGEVLKDYDPQIFSAFVGKIKGQYITNTVIKIDPEIWPLPLSEKIIYDNYLSQNLLNLPSSFSLNIDPEDLL